MTETAYLPAEARPRIKIDQILALADWVVQAGDDYPEGVPADLG